MIYKLGRQPVNINVIGANNVIPALTDTDKRIVILGAFLNNSDGAGDQVVTFKSAANVLSGPIRLAPKSSIWLNPVDNWEIGWLRCNKAEAFNIDLSAATILSGWLLYAEAR